MKAIVEDRGEGGDKLEFPRMKGYKCHHTGKNLFFWTYKSRRSLSGARLFWRFLFVYTCESGARLTYKLLYYVCRLDFEKLHNVLGVLAPFHKIFLCILAPTFRVSVGSNKKVDKMTGWRGMMESLSVNV